MPVDYSIAVLAAYEKKKEDGSLSPNLFDPKPGDFREECLSVYRKRPEKRGEEIIEFFFKTEIPSGGYYGFLEQTYAHQYKQLPKILAGEVPNAGLRYFELLAWLIDFQPRPSTAYYKSFYASAGNDSENKSIVASLVPKENDIGGSYVDTVTVSNDSKDAEKEIILLSDNISKDKEGVKSKKINIKLFVLVGITIFLILGKITFFVWESNILTTRKATANEKCMYWTGYHYEPVACNESVSGSSVIPLDPDRLSRFKKIPFFVKVTRRDIGKLWWGKIDGKPEYFTGSGLHPLDSNKRLLPLSSYMVAKYETEKNLIIDFLNWLYYAVVLVLGGILSVYFLKRFSGNKNRKN